MSDIPTPYPSSLGNLVKEYKLSAGRIRQLILICCFSAVMALCFWLPAIYDRSLSNLGQRIAVSFVGLFVASPMFAGIAQIFRLRRVSLGLYEYGLVYRRGGREFSTTWDEIDSYIEESACRITKKDGEVIEFGPSIEGIAEVAQEIKEQTLQRMLPQVKAAILSGASLKFEGFKPFRKSFPGQSLNNFAFASSGFSVDAHSLTGLESGKHIAWQDVTGYGIRQEKMGKLLVDVFFIQDNTTSLQTQLGLLSNAHVLLALCAEMTGRDPEDGA